MGWGIKLPSIKVPKLPTLKWDPVKDISAGVSDLSNGFNRDVSALSKNVERNGQNLLAGWARAASGDFNNFDRTLLDSALFASSGGTSLALNPDDVGRATKETATERAVSDAETKAGQEAQAAADAVQNAATADVASTISGQVAARSRAPGRGQTLLSTGAGRSNTLLSLMRS